MQPSAILPNFLSGMRDFLAKSFNISHNMSANDKWSFIKKVLFFPTVVCPFVPFSVPGHLPVMQLCRVNAHEFRAAAIKQYNGLWDLSWILYLKKKTRKCLQCILRSKLLTNASSLETKPQGENTGDARAMTTGREHHHGRPRHQFPQPSQRWPTRCRFRPFIKASWFLKINCWLEVSAASVYLCRPVPAFQL